MMMWTTPSYNELGSKAREVFTKGYHIGFWKVSLASIISGAEIKTIGETTHSGKWLGSIEGKYTVGEEGIQLYGKFNTYTDLIAKITVENKVVEGLRSALEAKYGFSSSNFGAKLIFGYGQENFKIDTDISIKQKPLINFAAVIGHQQFAFGWQTGYNIASSSMVANNLALTFTDENIILHGYINNFLNNSRMFGATCYSKCSEDLECSLAVGYGSSLSLGLGCAYNINEDSAFRAKVNKDLQVGLGYQQKIREGITLFCSTLLEGKDPQAGGHKVGMCLEIEA